MPKRSGKIFERLALWDDPMARDGPTQMACDEALLSEIQRPTMRLFRWSAPWVSAGYFVDIGEAKAVRPDLPVCRRWTGGGVVVHDGDFTFSLSVPREDALASARPAESYRRIHELLAAALRGAGIEAQLADTAESAPGQCFAGPVRHDVLSAGAKIAGGAQRRTRRGLLHQGSIQGSRTPERDFGELLGGMLADRVEPWLPPPGFEETVERLRSEKYASPDFLRGPAKAMNFTRTKMS